MEFRKVLTAGFAMFAMLFGAGNVVFSLILGRDTGHQLLFGLIGFLLTAVLVPLLGLASVILNHGDYKVLLATMGKIPAFFITLVSMVLIGPFAVIPRCITISHAALKIHLPSLDLLFFSIIIAGIIFLCTIKNSFLIDLLGKYLGPLKLTLLFAIIAKGFFAPSVPIALAITKTEALSKGLFMGYGSCDLLATVFLSGLILSGLHKGMHPEKKSDTWAIIKWGLQATIVGGICLAIVYIGFCTVANSYGAQLATLQGSDLFSALTLLILGPQGGLFANITIAVSCITTAIALTGVFAMYLHKDLSAGRLSYITSLLITIFITTFMASLGFGAIMKMLGPIIQVIYPILIVYTVVNIGIKLWKLETHQPVDLTMEPESSDWEEEQ